MKKIIILLLATVLTLALAGCKATLHCDGCGKEIQGDPNMDESWYIYCEACEPDIDLE